MHYSTCVLVIVLTLSTACGDGATSSIDADTPLGDMSPSDPSPEMDAGVFPAEAEAVTVDGTYSVPVTDPLLEPFASQPVVVDWRDSNGQYRLDYDFPTDLTGVSQRVSFEGVRTGDGPILLDGDLGSASCSPATVGAGLVCMERFPQLAFDLDRLQRDLERRGLPSDEIARRIEVATFFQSDPIGILSFTLE